MILIICRQDITGLCKYDGLTVVGVHDYARRRRFANDNCLEDRCFSCGEMEHRNGRQADGKIRWEGRPADEIPKQES